jgi:sulfur relay (sulfurtransferase) DsrC/TusE family protein
MVSEEGIEKALEDIEVLKKELGELKTDHVEVVKQLREEITYLSQFTCGMKINADVRTIHNIINGQFSGKSTLVTQLFADAAAAKTEVYNSQHPYEIEKEFHDKWTTKLEKMGAKIIIF